MYLKPRRNKIKEGVKEIEVKLKVLNGEFNGHAYAYVWCMCIMIIYNAAICN